MMRWLSLAWCCWLAGCASGSTRVPAKPAAAVGRSELCATFRVSARGPACIERLSPEQAARRELSYRLHYQGASVARVARLNGRGKPNPDDEGSVEYVYRYERGRLVETTGRNRHGNVSERMLYDQDQTVLRHVDEWGRPAISAEREHVSERIERDEHGFARSIRFIGLDGQPARSGSGAYEVRYERDARGLERSYCYFDPHGRPMRSRSGIHCVRIARDRFGNDLESSYFDERGQPLASFGGDHRVVSVADQWGNIVRISWFGLDGAPPPKTRARCPTVVKHFDAGGFQTGADCLDERGAPARWRDGNSYWRSTPDAAGETSETSFFNARGEPVRVSEGYASYRFERNAQGDLLSRRFFLENGAPGQRRGPALVRYSRRGDGMLLAEQYFDSNERPTTDRGCFRRRWEYDDHRQVITAACTGLEGELLPDNRGVALTRYRYDDNGLLREERYFDQQQQPVNSDLDYATVRYEYDGKGTERRRLHFSVDGAARSLPRWRGLQVRPPYADTNFIPGSRQDALSRLARARGELLAGAPFEQVAERYGEAKLSLKHPGDIGYIELKRMYAAVRTAVESLSVGEFSEIVELPGGIWVYQRTE